MQQKQGTSATRQSWGLHTVIWLGCHNFIIMSCRAALWRPVEALHATAQLAGDAYWCLVNSAQ